MPVCSSVQNAPASGVKTIRFIRRGEAVCLSNVPPSRTLLEVLREDLRATGTKEGCGEGDCGACTVVLATAEHGALRFRAVNSCIRLAHSIDGMALFTVEDLANEAASPSPPLQAGAVELASPGHRRSGPPGGQEAHAVSDRGGHIQAGAVEPASPGHRRSVPLAGQRPALAAERGGHLHPVQQAMLEHHASQCGFCTPGFVMSLYAMYQNHVCKGHTINRELAQQELSGNLCRCTGYRPILDAAQAMAAYPRVLLDEAGLLSKLELLAPADPGQTADSAYKLPQNLAQLLQHRAEHPQAQLVAGCTDVGLWVTKQHRQFDRIIDLTQVHELRQIHETPGHIEIGAAVPLADAFAVLARSRPQLHTFASRFAGLPVRNSGTLGGNVANGSPIGDSMPLLIALGASLVLASLRGERELPLEAFYTGYRQNVLAADEVLAWIRVPKPRTEGPELLSVNKVSKRFDDDISAVCLAIRMQLDQDGKVLSASIGAGGVAATPARARNTEAALVGQTWTQATVTHAMAVLRAEFSPISDMRASRGYRLQVLGNLLQRCWLESQGLQQIRLEAFDMASLEATR